MYSKKQTEKRRGKINSGKKRKAYRSKEMDRGINKTQSQREKNEYENKVI
jgi:hypothetical protein